MNARVISLTFTFFLSFLPWEKKAGMDNKELNLSLKCYTKQKTQQEEEDGFSLNFVINGFSGSLSPLTLIFITMCIFISTCGGEEMSSSDIKTASVFEGYKTISNDWSLFTPSRVLLAVVATTGLVLAGFACSACCKKGSTELRESAPAETGEHRPLACAVEVPQDEDTKKTACLEKKNAVINTVTELKKELGKHRDQLTQQLGRIETGRNENKMKLRQVDDTPALLREKDDLLNVKSKLDDEQRTYGTFVLSVDQMLQTTDTLLAIVTE